MRYGGIRACCEDDKHTNSDGGKERRCGSSEPASTIHPDHVIRRGEPL
jgi:hypothetical protein